jgi:hypothetical protein
MAMLPPTAATLAFVDRHATAASALAAGAVAEVVPLLPAPVLEPDGAVSWHLLHDRTRERVRFGGEPTASETDGVAPRGPGS